MCFVTCVFVLSVACGDDTATSANSGTGGNGGNGDGAAGGSGGATAGWSRAPDLPEPVANNAVAAVVAADGGCTLLSAYGIDATLASTGIHRRAFSWREGDAQWQSVADVPVMQGRIAASAVGLRGKFYLLGGYSVAADESETTYDDMLVFDPSASSWSTAAPLPLGIDDAAVVAWRDRYIVVISGWSNAQQPVADVQIYDVESDNWAMATPFPGTPVFGHAAALVGDELVVIDGAAQVALNYAPIAQAWRGTLDPNNPTVIAWTDLGGHPAPTRYRAAAASRAGELLFHGGTDAPYNFDGLAYVGGQPSPPLASTLGYALAPGTFATALEDKPTATMDHRGLPDCGGRLYAVGGMVSGPQVTAEVWRHTAK